MQSWLGSVAGPGGTLLYGKFLEAIILTEMEVWNFLSE